MVISGNRSTEGKTIRFKICGLGANEIDTWEQGGHNDPVFTITATTGNL